MTLERHAWETVDLDFGRLTRTHMGELRFLVVCDDVDGMHWHYRHQGRAGLHELADAQRPRAYRAVDWRADRRVAEVQLGLVPVGEAAIAGRLGPRALRLEHIDFALGHQE